MLNFEFLGGRGLNLLKMEYVEMVVDMSIRLSILSTRKRIL
jgi:hypothetical protein